jgi:autotransporter-associated beta strand protein
MNTPETTPNPVRIPRSHSFKNPPLIFLAMGLALLASTLISRAASGTWITDASGVWSAPANWLNGTIAGGTDATADFSTINITADRTVTLDSAQSAGALLFGDTSGGQNWFLNASGGSVLTLAVSSGSPTITVANTATINAPLAGTAGLTKTGNGTLVLGGTNNYSGTTTISTGTLKLPAPVVNASTVPTPLLYMSFDNVSGSTVNNDGSGGAAMSGTLTGSATIVSGGRLGGNALSIPATVNAGYVLITNSVVPFSGSSAWTVAMWIKTTTAGGVYLYQGNGAWNNTGGANTVFHLNNGGNNGAGSGMGIDGRGSFAGGVSYGRGWQSGSTVVNDGNWHFVVMTCDASNTKVSYVDGNLDSWSENTWSGAAGGTNVWIGACGETGDGVAGLNGLIDEVSIYNTTLNQSQVRALMAVGTVPGSSPVSVAAASTLDLNGTWQTVAGLSGSGTVDSTLAGGVPMLTVNNSATASTFGGVIANTAGSLSLVKAGTNSLTLNGTAANTYTGSTMVNGGSLIEDFANATSATDLINNGSTLVLGGGALQVLQKSGTTTSQTFAGTTINPGFSKVIGTQVGSGAVNIALGALTQNPGGTVDFTNTSTGTITTTTANVNDILGGWATVGESVASTTSGGWAANDGSGNIVPYTGYTFVSGAQTGSGASAQNWKTTAAASLSASATINSLVMDGSGDFTVANSITLTIASGGLMFEGTQRWLVAGGSASTLKSGLPTGELYIYSATNYPDFEIGPAIADGSVPTTLYKDGIGTLSLAKYAKTYTGGTVVNGGTLQLALGGGTGVIRGAVTVNSGATLQLGAVDAVGYNAGVCVSAINVNGGTLTNSSGGNEGYLMDINLTGGKVTSSGGNYVFSAQTTPVYGINCNPSPVTSLFSAPIHFNGLGFINVAPGTTPSGIDLIISGIINYGTNITRNGAGTILLSGVNTFAGGWINNAGMLIISNSSSLGTGAGTLTMNGGSISNYAGTSFSVANVVNLAGPVNFGVGAGDTLTLSSVITNTGSLTKTGAGTLKFGNVASYGGSTTISGGTLALGSSGSITGSTNITVASGATLDVSGTSSGQITLSGSQRLMGSGTVTGAVATASGTRIYAGTDGGYGTNTFKNNLTLASGTLCYFDLGTVANGSNDQIVVTGNLTNNNNLIHIKAPSTLVGLDQTNDYVLFSAAGGITGTFPVAPVWDVAPTNATHFRIVTGANTVTLHYDPSLTMPSGTGTPETVTRNQSTLLSVTVTPGTYPISTVIVDASSLGGSSTLALMLSGVSNVYTNTVIIPPTNSVGSNTLNVLITDQQAFFGLTTIPVTVIVANQVWNGGSLADDNWTDNTNWQSGVSPAYWGDAVTFAGTTRLTPSVNYNYSLTGILFDSTAGGFTIGTANSSTLTLTGSGLTNNSTATQTLNLPLVLGAEQNFNASAGNLVFSQYLTNNGYAAIVRGSSNTLVSGTLTGTGGLTKADNGTLTISGVETYSGATTVTGGVANVTGALNNSSALNVNNSTLNLTGTLTNTALDTIGGTVGNAVLNIAGGNLQEIYTPTAVYSSSLNVGTVAGAVGDIQLSSGTFNLNRQLAVGTTGFGGYSQSGGLTMVGGFLALGGTANGGVFNQSGGIFTLTGGASATLGYSVATSYGVMNLSGSAVFNVTGAGNGVWPGEVGTGILNVFGNAALNITGSGVILAKGAAGVGVANLLGGTTTVNSVSKGTGAGTLNFNGGTLKANMATNAFVSGLTGVYLYSGGAVIDSGGYNITVAQTLQAPTSYGVTSIAVLNGGSGYIETPAVMITNISASGSGAMAVATVSGGVVTGITVTCPGQNYYPGDILGVALIGGGGSGAVIDTPVLVPNISGGLTKVGSGSLTLTDGNAYTNATKVFGGTLNWDANSVSTPGDMVVSNGTLVINAGYYIPYTPVSLTLQSNAALTFAYGTMGNPSFTVITAGNLITSGTNIINVTGSGFTVGQFPLIAYSSAPLASISNFGLGTLPAGVTANLSNNATATPPTIDLVISRTGQNLTWYGANSSGTLETNWDIATSLNWTYGTLAYSEYGTGVSAIGDLVTFDDNMYGFQTTNVNLTTTLHPALITVSSSQPYSFTGPGSIAGAGSLTMNGYGSLFLGTTNSYTGGTFINTGTVIITNDAGLGDSAGLVTLNGGMLEFAANMTSPRTLTFTADSSLGVTTNATAQLSSAFSGSGGLTKADNGTLALLANNTIGGTLTVNQGILSLAGNNTIGGMVTVNQGMLATAGSNYISGSLLVNGGAFVNSGTNIIVGLTEIGTASGYNAVMTNRGNLTQSNLFVGNISGAYGAVYQTGGTVTVSGGGGDLFDVGNVTGAVGYYDMIGGTITANGVAVGGENNTGTGFTGTGGNGIMDINGGTVSDTGWFVLGRGMTDTAETGILNVYSGLLTYAGGGIACNWGTNETSVINVMGGVVTNTAAVGINLNWMGNTNNYGFLNLNGGLVQATAVTGGANNTRVAFNGGTLRASTNSTTFLTGLAGVKIFNGGAIVDDGGYTITIGQPLLAANGYGVRSISLSNGGSGYIMPPFVTITGGSGSNALATATVSGGVVTGIIIACPGAGYNSTDALTVSFSGGGVSAVAPTVSTVALAQNGTGGLTKNGSGTLTLTGVNTFAGPITNNAGTLSLNSISTYSGPAFVNGGSLLMTTASQLAGNVTVNNGAVFSLAQVGTATNVIGSLALGQTDGNGATLSLSLASGSTTMPLLTCGTLTLTGSNTLTIAGAFSVGVVPLVHYSGTIAGTGFFNTNLIAPRGVVATLSNSVSTSTLYAVITQIGSGIVWTGSSSIAPNLWDIATSTNWVIGASPTTYLEWDAVTFNDLGSGVVTLNTNVNPNSVVISNTAVSYTFSGSGHLAGSAGLTKTGTNSVTMNLTGNTYTGNTVISNGTFKIGAANVIPGGTGNGNVILNGLLDLNTFSNSINGLTGTGIVDTMAGGTASLTVGGNNAASSFAGSIRNTAGTLSLIKTGTNTLTLTGSNTFSGNLFANAGTVVIDSGGSANNITSWVSIGQQNTDNATLTLKGTGSLATTFDFNVGDIGSAMGTMNVQDNASLTVSNFFIASANAAGSTASGTVNQTGGSVTQTSPTVGTFVIGGRTSASGVGVYNLSGGTLTATAGIRVGSYGTGTFNQSGGTVIANGGVNIARLTNSVGTYNLNGGTLSTYNVTSSMTNNAVFNFNGGLLQALNPGSPFLSALQAANVLAGGAIIDSGTNSITVSQPLLYGGIGTGGLAKLGTGALTLSGANTYIGATVISNGTLIVDGSLSSASAVTNYGGTLAGAGTINGPVVVPAGTLRAGDLAGIGTLTINNSLTMQGNTVLRISKTGGVLTHDLVTGLTTANYGGTLIVSNVTSDSMALAANDAFTLFSAGTHNGHFTSIVGTPGTGLAYSFTNGVLSIVATMANNPTNITATVSGSTLTLTWPADHVGWILQSQTNSLAAGLGTNWVDVTGSTANNTNAITINPTSPSVFFRLRHP